MCSVNLNVPGRECTIKSDETGNIPTNTNVEKFSAFFKKRVEKFLTHFLKKVGEKITPTIAGVIFISLILAYSGLRSGRL